jgi:hypothetical protein
MEQRSSINESEKTFLQMAASFLRAVSNELDPYTSKKGKISLRGKKITLETPSHIQFAKYGRGPGKNPPLDPILQWVKSEGIIFDNTDEEGTARAIQFSIGKKGTKNWKPNAPNALAEAVNMHIKDYNTEFAKMIGIAIKRDTEKIYTETLPRGEFKI